MLSQLAASERGAHEPTLIGRALRFAAGNSFYYAACAALLAVAAALRFYDLGGADLHSDEAIDVLQARGSFSEMIESLRCCNSGPVVRSLLLRAAQFVSISEFSVRVPSAVASVLTVAALVFLLPRVGVGKPAAFLAGLMATVSAPALLHARDARIYGIDALVAALIIVGLLAYLKSGRKALLCVSLFIAPLTQFGLTLFAAAALGTLAISRAAALLAPASRLGYTAPGAAAEAAPLGPPQASTGRRAGVARRMIRLGLDLAWPSACFLAGCAATYALTLRYQLAALERVSGYLPSHYYASSESESVLVFALSGIWDMLNYHLPVAAALAGLAALGAVFAVRIATGFRINPIVLLFALSLASVGAAAALSVYPLGGIRQNMYLGPVIFVTFGYALHAASIRFPLRARGAWVALLAGVIAVTGAWEVAERNIYAAPRGFERILAALEDAAEDDAVYVAGRVDTIMRFHQDERADAYSYGNCTWDSASECLADLRSKTGRVGGSGKIWLVLQDNPTIAEISDRLEQGGAERVAGNSENISLYLVRDRNLLFGSDEDAFRLPPSGEPVARSAFDIYLTGDEIVYLKKPCEQADTDTEARFFLLIIPERVEDLPEEHAAEGFERMDFEFFRWGEYFDGKCMARVPLPEYPIASIRTWQWAHDGGELWDAAFPFDSTRSRAAYAAAASREPDARAAFNIHLNKDERALTYTRAPCAPSDVEPPFFLHVTPERASDLPKERREYGFDNLDFDFRLNGVVFNGKCAAVIALPEYAIARIKTGQFTRGGGRVWEAGFAVGLPSA